jgi:hypothetical protein
VSPAAPSRGEPAIDVADLPRTYRTTTGTVRRRRLEIDAVRGISLAGIPQLELRRVPRRDLTAGQTGVRR